MVVERDRSSAGGTECSQAVCYEALTKTFEICVTKESHVPSTVKSKNIRTYKRQKRKKSSSECILLEHGSASMEVACHIAAQESEACALGRHASRSEEGLFTDGTQLFDKLHEVLSTNEYKNDANHDSSATMYRRVLSNILASEKFTSLSKLCEKFRGDKGDQIFSMGVIDSKIREGVYEQSPLLFSTDVQEVWKKIQGIGNEMVLLAKSLSDLSLTSYAEEICAHQLQSHVKLENLKGDGVHEILRCNQCGQIANNRDCLVCDHCEDMYHMSCNRLAVKEIPRKNWSCLNCTANGIGPLHQNCVVCERLNNPTTQRSNALVEMNVACIQSFKDLVENCNMDDELNQSEGKHKAEACRVCGNQVINSGNFITCDHPYCNHKYHVRCLTMKQLNPLGPIWYCPSCLCRNCLIDKDDEKIVLCDGCDDAYHIYCMKPPLSLIPEGKWFCKKCKDAIQQIRRAKGAYETKGNLRKQKRGAKGKGVRNCEDKPNGKCMGEVYKGREGMDMLLNAANTLSYQERLAAHQM